MAQDFPPSDFLDKADDAPLLEFDLDDLRAAGPSLPIILFGTACGVGGGVIVLYLAYRVILFTLPVSAGIATFVLLAVLGSVAGGLSVLTRSHALANIVFSCGLILLTVFFFGLCSLVGALAATLILNLQ